MATKQAILDAAKIYAQEDEESPRRGAIFFLTEDAFCDGSLTDAKYDEI